MLGTEPKPRHWSSSAGSQLQLCPCSGFPNHSCPGMPGWDPPWSLLQETQTSSSSSSIGKSCSGLFWFLPPLSDTCDRLAPIFDSALHFRCVPRQFAARALCYCLCCVSVAREELPSSGCSLSTNTLPSPGCAVAAGLYRSFQLLEPRFCLSTFSLAAGHVFV